MQDGQDNSPSPRNCRAPPKKILQVRKDLNVSRVLKQDGQDEQDFQDNSPSPRSCRALQVRKDLNVYRFSAGTGGQGP